MRAWRPDLGREFVEFVVLIRRDGVVKAWPWDAARPRYHHAYLELDGREYWTMGSPVPGAPDLNDERAIEASGVLFMDGEGEPGELASIKRRPADLAHENQGTGEWLGNAMKASWQVAEQLLQFPELADVLGERHRIIPNDWQNANTATVIATSWTAPSRSWSAWTSYQPRCKRTWLARDRRGTTYLSPRIALSLTYHPDDLLVSRIRTIGR